MRMYIQVEKWSGGVEIINFFAYVRAYVRKKINKIAAPSAPSAPFCQ